LRPYGNAGALATSYTGFRQYYREDGPAQQFERMALVKLRPVAGDPVLGKHVEQARDGYVYSGRPLDIADIRHLRHRQATELVAAGAVNAKYSAGGLVDVEYFVQARQIEAGHTQPSVRTTNTMDAIDRLREAGVFSATQATHLRECYSFLRRLIDALRVVRGNAKDLTIPLSDSREFAYLTRRLGYDTPAQLRAAIDDRMRFARGLWDSL
jgi:glutamate-ammonia-ligase adenylyltransferase